MREVLSPRLVKKKKHKRKLKKFTVSVLYLDSVGSLVCGVRMIKMPLSLGAVMNELMG